jgi:serine protease Do
MQRSKTSIASPKLRLMTSAAVLAVLLAVGPQASAFAGAAAPDATAHAGESQRPAGFADLVAKVKPAVISVRVKMEDSGDAPASSGAPDSMEKFFRQFGDETMPGHRRHVITGEGSGFFVSSDGYAVTNYHVVDHAKSVQVTTDDGASYTARVIGTDQKTDLALIKVDAEKEFTYVKFGDTPPRVGDWAVAVGNPFGLGGTVTAGIVSARGRDIGAGPYDDYIQIDAPINKGNSGGPTFNANGDVIGVNTAIYSPSGGSVGIGFDIPAETAKSVVAQLKEKGGVTRGWIGLQIQPVTKDMADSLGLEGKQGAIVTEPQRGSPAAQAGVLTGDVITAIDDSALKGTRDLARKISGLAPGSVVKLDIVRNGDNKELKVTIAEMPNERHAERHSDGMRAERSGYLGLRMAPAGQMNGAVDRGVVVTGIDPDGPASEWGIRPGDVILAIGGSEVIEPDDVRAALAQARSAGKDHVLLRLRSDETTRFVAVPVG